jgi:hypothetical protein
MKNVLQHCVLTLSTFPQGCRVCEQPPGADEGNRGRAGEGQGEEFQPEVSVVYLQFNFMSYV